MERAASFSSNYSPGHVLLHPSLRRNDSATSGVLSERSTSSGRKHGQKHPTKRPKTRSIQAIIEGRVDESSDGAQDAGNTARPPCLPIYHPTFPGRVTYTSPSKTPPTNEGHSSQPFSSCGLMTQNENNGDQKGIFESAAEILQISAESGRKTYAKKVKGLLETLEAYAGPEWLHEALDRFYVRERARSKARRRRKSTKK